MVTKFSEKFAIIMLKKHRKFCRCGLIHLDATPIFKKSFRYLWVALYNFVYQINRLISTRCIHGFMSNLIKKSRTDSNCQLPGFKTLSTPLLLRYLLKVSAQLTNPIKSIQFMRPQREKKYSKRIQPLLHKFDKDLFDELDSIKEKNVQQLCITVKTYLLDQIYHAIAME